MARVSIERKLALYFNAEAISYNPEPHTIKSIQPKYEYENLNLKRKNRLGKLTWIHHNSELDSTN